MPNPSEHSCRLTEPDKCRDGSFRRENGAKESGGRKIDVIYASLKDSGEEVEQAYRYPADSWPESKAREHCREAKGISFEPAAKDKGMFLDVAQPMAITEAGLEALMQTLSGLDDLKGLMVKEGYAPQETSLTRVRGGVAVIDVFGPILRIDSFIAWILGLSSVDAIAADVLKAMENNQVSSIILNIDSPGGQIAGVNELANHIAEAGKVKPVYAYASHQMASAAYWLGASAKEIVADATAAVGSIGVVAGLRRSFGGRIEIVNSASPKKRLDPESDEGRREVLKRVDAVAEIFISAVMAGRNLSREAVVGLEGGILTGQQAVEHGLADRIGGLEQLISELNHAKPYSGGMAMDKSQLQTEHADLYQEVLNEGKEQGRQEAEQGLGEAKEAAGKEARESVLALAKSAFGEELGAKLTQLVESGVTADQVKALSESGLFAGQGQGGQEPVDPSKQAVIDALEESSQEPPGSLKGGGDDIEATWNKDPKVRAEFGDNFEAFKAYTENARAGRARILSRPEQ